MRTRPKIIVDSREIRVAPKIFKTLKKLGGIVEVKPLTVGDYILSEEVAVERKTVNDFISTLTRRDLFEQIYSLKTVYPRSFIVLEGNLEYTKKFRKIHVNSILGAFALLARSGIPVIPTANQEETAKLLFFTARQEQEKREKIPQVKPIKKVRSISEYQLLLIGSLPSIGRERAINILKIYKTPLQALNNFRSWSKKVRGIGEETIRKVEKVLTEEFSIDKVDKLK